MGCFLTVKSHLYFTQYTYPSFTAYPRIRFPIPTRHSLVRKHDYQFRHAVKGIEMLRSLSYLSALIKNVFRHSHASSSYFPLKLCPPPSIS